MTARHEVAYELGVFIEFLTRYAHLGNPSETLDRVRQLNGWLELQARRSRGGRPSGSDLWAREFADKWRIVEQRAKRQPKQREMADEMGLSLHYLKERYRAVIGVAWKEYQPPENFPHLYPLPDRREASA